MELIRRLQKKLGSYNMVSFQSFYLFIFFIMEIILFQGLQSCPNIPTHPPTFWHIHTILEANSESFICSCEYKICMLFKIVCNSFWWKAIFPYPIYLLVYTLFKNMIQDSSMNTREQAINI